MTWCTQASEHGPHADVVDGQLHTCVGVTHEPSIALKRLIYQAMDTHWEQLDRDGGRIARFPTCVECGSDLPVAEGGDGDFNAHVAAAIANVVTDYFSKKEAERHGQKDTR